jgi:hypothetical protein
VGQLEVGEPGDALDIFDGQCGGHPAMLSLHPAREQRPRWIVDQSDTLFK